MTRYPQTGDFITNVSARQGEVGQNLSPLRSRSSLFVEPMVLGAIMAYGRFPEMELVHISSSWASKDDGR